MARTFKLNPSLKLALLVGGLMGGAFLGYEAYVRTTVDAKVFAPLEPDEVTLLAVDRKSGYRVIVANQMAQLAMPQSGQTGDEYDETTEADASNLKRLPIREYVSALKGDSAGMSVLTERMNNLDAQDRLPTTKVIWSRADIRRALGGDTFLANKLRKDLNVELDGTPLEGFRLDAIENGIVVPVPFKVTFTTGGSTRTVTGELQEGFVSNFANAVQARYSGEPDVTAQKIAAYYTEEARNILNGKNKKQDVRQALESLIADDSHQSWAKGPASLLTATNVLLNSKLLSGVTTDVEKLDSGKEFLNIHLQLTPEGRTRLWQFSRRNENFQLLLIVNGIAIAAPVVREELSGSTVTISHVPNEDFIRETIPTIQRLVQNKNS